MVVRDAHAGWNHDLKQGHGTIGFGNVEELYAFASRFETAQGANPKVLIGVAHADCFSMALALVLGKAGHKPVSIRTDAKVFLDADRLAISRIALYTVAHVPGLDETSFRRYTEDAKRARPLSKAVAGVEIVLAEACLSAAHLH